MSDNPSNGGNQNPRPRKPTIEDTILEVLRGSAKKAGAELEGLVVSTRIAEAEESVAKREAKAIITKAINYAKGIAADKKFRPYHLLRELGIKMPSDNDGADNAAGKPKARRKTDPAQPEQGNSGSGKTEPAKPAPGIAGEAES